LRDDTQTATNADLRGRLADRGRPALSAAASAATASAAAADGLLGRIDGPGRHRLPASAASAADAEEVGRARLSFKSPSAPRDHSPAPRLSEGRGSQLHVRLGPGGLVLLARFGGLSGVALRCERLA